MTLHFRLLICTCVAAALLAYEIPDGGRDLVAGEFPDVATLGNSGDPDAAAEVVAVEGRDFARALRVTTTRKPEHPWGVVVHVPTAGAVERGDVVLLSFWMRTLESGDESGDGVAVAFFERDHPPHRNFARIKATAGGEWRHCIAPGIADRSWADGEHQVAIHCGFHPQAVEIGGLRLLDFGDEVALRDLPYMESTYQGRAADAPWRAEAAARIERYRKGDLAVRVVDADGEPVPGAEVAAAMQRHAFDFGCVLNPGAFANLEGEDLKRYREIFAEYFTKAPTESGFRWQNWIRGGDEAIGRRKRQLEEALTWLGDHDIEIRGHYLMWAPIQERNKPVDLIDDPEALLAAKWAHAEEIATWAGERVQEWDAVNHIVAGGMAERFSDVYGGNRVYADMITKGRAWAPHAEMWVNEGQILVGTGDRVEAYRAVIADLAAMDAKPDGIGFMAHYRDTHLPHPAEVYRRIERFAEFDCKLQLTEFDVECGPQEQLQADYLRDAMTICFSHPQMEGIVMWGFWEGRHWRPSAALWRRDWSLKPAGEAWIELVREQWWTDESGTTDNDGNYLVRGYCGDYRVTVAHDGRSGTADAVLGREGTAVTVRLE